MADKGQTDGNCSIRLSSRKQLQVQKRCKITNSSLNEVQNEESGANEKKSAAKNTCIIIKRAANQETISNEKRSANEKPSCSKPAGGALKVTAQ